MVLVMKMLLLGPELQAAVRLARQQAGEMGCRAAGPEQLLLAIARCGGAPGALLRGAGLQEEALRALCGRRAGNRPRTARRLTASARRLIRHARQEAAALGAARLLP